MTDVQAVCLSCGVSKGTGSSYCPNCGSPVNKDAVICTSCGVALGNTTATKTATINGQDKTTLAIICFFLGGWGIHNFMMGETTRGVLKIVLWLFGLSWIWALIDFIQILTDTYVVDAEARPVGHQSAAGAQTVSGSAPRRKAVQPDDAPNFGFAVLGFFFPIIGLILHIIYHDEYPKKAASAGKGAIWGAVVSVALLILIPLIFILGYIVLGIILSIVSAVLLILYLCVIIFAGLMSMLLV